MTIDEIITRLKEGNLRFVNDCLNQEHQRSVTRKSVINGQEPFAVVLSCVDSRVVPELIFDTGIGELFVVRVGGNVANQSSVSAIEYAVAYLETIVIVVLGHQNCGTVTAAVEGGEIGTNIRKMVELVKPALDISPKDATVNQVAKINARYSPY